MLKLGSHVSNNGTLMLEGSINEALSYNETCFMVYLGAPQNTVRKFTSEMHIEEFHNIAKINNINLEDVIIHAPYIVNLARTDIEKYDFAVSFLTQELKGVKDIGCKYLVFHPGSAVEGDRSIALKQVSKGINEILNNTLGDNTCILIETMSGKGNEVGITFEEVKTILDNITDKSRIGVCIDTCHIHDSGYDIVNDYKNVISYLDKVIGLSNIKAIHLNDSKNPCGAHKDRHENIGFGYIGFDTICKFLYDERFSNIPKILETPYIPLVDIDRSVPPYKYEIEMLKSKKFNPNLKELIITEGSN